MATRYLSCEEVVELHDKILQRQGVSPQPLRSRDALDGALARVEHLAHYESSSLAEQAAALAISISQAQAFVDGNKRTGYMALIRFLDLNGFVFTGDGLHLAKYLEVQAFLSQIAGKGDEPSRLGREALTIWIESVIQPKTQGYRVVITGSVSPSQQPE